MSQNMRAHKKIAYWVSPSNELRENTEILPAFGREAWTNPESLEYSYYIQSFVVHDLMISTFNKFIFATKSK